MVGAHANFESFASLQRAYRERSNTMDIHPSHLVQEPAENECIRCGYGVHDHPERWAEPCPVSPEQEVAFLRYFFNEAAHAFGPADSDVYLAIEEDYDGVMPRGYSEKRFDEEA